MSMHEQHGKTAAVSYLFTAANSDCFFYSTSVLNCLCKRNFLTKSPSSYTIRHERLFFKTNSMLCSVAKKGFFSCKGPSIDYQPRTPKSKQAGESLPSLTQVTVLSWCGPTATGHYQVLQYRTCTMLHHTKSQQKHVVAFLYLWK